MYKALIFDLDGTAIPNKPDGMPSETLIRVVTQLRKSMKVCAATGRTWLNSKAVIRKLMLHDPCIISGGTQIINPADEKILWEKDMEQPLVELTMDVARHFPYKVIFGNDDASMPAKNKVVRGPERIIYIESVSKEDATTMLKLLRQIPRITAYEVKSWTLGYFDIHVTHSEATKSHALQILLKMLNLRKEEVVAAGDSNNDLPLFEMSGYKIAMENGSSEMKTSADMIAQDVSNDGLAVALKKLFF